MLMKIFSQVIPRFNESLVLFHGWANDGEIVTVSKRYRHNDDILFAYVDANEDDAPLVKKFNIDVKNLPALKLYKEFGRTDVSFSGEWKTDNIIKWLVKNSDLTLTLPSCIRSLDEMARSFIRSEPSSRAKILEEAKREAAKFSSDKEENISAQVYLKLMRRIIERGSIFLASEETRVNNLISSKITETKKNELQVRLNIIQSFKFEPEQEADAGEPVELVREGRTNSGCGCSKGKSSKVDNEIAAPSEKDEL